MGLKCGDGGPKWSKLENKGQNTEEKPTQVREDGGRSEAAQTIVRGREKLRKGGLYWCEEVVNT